MRKAHSILHLTDKEVKIQIFQLQLQRILCLFQQIQMSNIIKGRVEDRIKMNDTNELVLKQ